MGIADRLRQFFKSHNLSLRSVSRMTGIPYRSLQNYVGAKRLPSIENLIKMHEQTGIDLHWLIVGDDKHEAQSVLISENNASYHTNSLLDLICQMLSEMSEEEQRDILKHLEEKKLLKELLLERKKNC